MLAERRSTMRSIFVTLNEFIKKASDTENQIIKYIINNPKKCINISIYELAKNTYSSTSTIVKISKKLGFNGFKDFKQTLIFEIGLSEHTKNISYKDKNCSTKELIDNLANMHINSINHTKSIIDMNILEKVMFHIINTEIIYLFGIGSSFLVAKDFQQKMLRLGKICILSEDYHMQLLHSKTISKNYIAIAFSYSGQTEVIYDCCENIKINDAILISITRLSASKISSISDFNLYTSNHEDIIRNGAFSSRISQLYMVDILYSCYIAKKYEYLASSINNTRIYKREE